MQIQTPQTAEQAQQTVEQHDFSETLVSATKLSKITYHFWLLGDIEEPMKYAKWLEICQKATDSDSIIVHINCDGGLVDTSIQLYTALCMTDADLIISIEGSCCSGASLIAMAAIKNGSMIMQDCAYMMIHTASGGILGKYSDMKKSSEFVQKHWNNTFKKIYSPFLTDAEIEEVLAGNDMWFDSDDVVKRLVKLSAEHAKQKQAEETKLDSIKKKCMSVISKSNKVTKADMKFIYDYIEAENDK